MPFLCLFCYQNLFLSKVVTDLTKEVNGLSVPFCNTTEYFAAATLDIDYGVIRFYAFNLLLPPSLHLMRFTCAALVKESHRCPCIRRSKQVLHRGAANDIIWCGLKPPE